MKKLFLLPALFLLSSSLFAENIVIEPKVDERTELMSIVFRLAGAEPYSMRQFVQSYSADIDKYFSPCTNHKIISFTQQVANELDAMKFAIYTEISADTIRFIKDAENDWVSQHWKVNSAEAKRYLELLNDFYRESNFHSFFEQHSQLYSVAEKRFADRLKAVDLDWFENFHGELPRGKFICIISLVNGGFSYGPSITHTDGSKDIYSVMGTWRTDKKGLPLYPDEIVPTFIHEYNHSFCNPLINQFYLQLRKKAKQFYRPVADAMRTTGWNNERVMLDEILVRACVIKYMEKNDASNVKERVAFEQARGFLWIDRLAASLDTYLANRDKYPTLRDYMPEIVKLQNSLSFGKVQEEVGRGWPVIVSTSVRNNDRNVDPNLTQIVFTFDRPMASPTMGLSYCSERMGNKIIPFITGREWNEDKKELIVKVELKPDTKYSISLWGWIFKGQDELPVNGIHYLDFKTRTRYTQVADSTAGKQ